MVSWDRTWFDVAGVVSRRSRCERAHVGAVVVDSRRRVVATGYNNPAAGYRNDGTCGGYCDRVVDGKSFCPSLHAEANALLYVDRSKCEGATLYSTVFPCIDCAKLISNSGIVRVVSIITDKDGHRDPSAVKEFLEQCGIIVDEVPNE